MALLIVLHLENTMSNILGGEWLKMTILRHNINCGINVKKLDQRC